MDINRITWYYTYYSKSLIEWAYQLIGIVLLVALSIFVIMYFLTEYQEYNQRRRHKKGRYE
jgi:hypothetical protein